MSAYAQHTPTHTPLHFQLSSPPLHIPLSLESLDSPTSKGFTYGLVRRPSDGNRRSVDEGMASVESWRVGMASRHSFKLDEKVRLIPPSLSIPNANHVHHLG